MSIYDAKINTLEGEPADLSEYKGKALLVVNVASKCGLTPQYEGLEKLHEKYAGRGFEVLGFPCNQFMGQEPGTRRGDPRVLRHHLRRRVPAVREDRRERRQPPPDLRGAHRRRPTPTARPAT